MWRVACCSILMCAFPSLALTPEYMDPRAAKEASTWLARNQNFRLASDEDCKCSEDIKTLRKGSSAPWKPQPNYHPYYAIGDFDADGIQDFAIVVRPKAQEVGAQILVFLRGSPSRESRVLSYPVPFDTLEDLGLFVRSAKGRGASLLFGAFSSEGEKVPVPLLR